VTSLEFDPYQIPQIHPRRLSVQNLLHHPKHICKHYTHSFFKGLLSGPVATENIHR